MAAAMSNVALDYATRRNLRRLISDARRECLGIPACPNGWGNLTGYGRDCRCAACVKAERDYRRDRRRKLGEQIRAKDKAYRASRRDERDAEIVRRRRGGDSCVEIMLALSVAESTVWRAVSRLAPELIGLRPREAGVAECGCCGRVFVPKRRTQAYCRNGCYLAAKNERKRLKRRVA